jgi:hypothetical protein
VCSESFGRSGSFVGTREIGVDVGKCRALAFVGMQLSECLKQLLTAYAWMHGDRNAILIKTRGSKQRIWHNPIRNI